MERAAKLRRVNVLRSSLPHMSQAALVAFLAKAQDEDIPAVRYTRDVRDARNAVALQDTPYGKLIVQAGLELRNGRTVSLDVSNSQALLYVSASRKMFSNHLMRVHEKQTCGPTRPWRLCIYCDEAKPGDVMKQDNARAFTKRVCRHVWMSVLLHSLKRIPGSSLEPQRPGTLLP